MKSVICVFVAVFLGAALAEEPRYYLPLDQPTSGTYEVREYVEAKWACTGEKEGSNMRGSMAFWKLFQYISGQNNKGQKIEMTAPVARFIKVNKDATLGDATVCFYLDRKAQTNTPVPTRSDIEVVKLSPRIIVRSFSSRLTNRVVIEQANQLSADVSAEGMHRYSSRYIASAGYTGPFTMAARSEIWFLAPQVIKMNNN